MPRQQSHQQPQQTVISLTNPPPEEDNPARWRWFRRFARAVACLLRTLLGTWLDSRVQAVSFEIGVCIQEAFDEVEEEGGLAAWEFP